MHDVYISVPDAILGTDVEVPTLKGRARVQIDPGTQSGKILRMRNRGLPDLQDRRRDEDKRRGDQMVRVHVWTPERVTDEEAALLEKLRHSASFAPDAASKSRDGERRSFFSKFKDVFA